MLEILGLIASGSTLLIVLIGGGLVGRWLVRTINEMDRHIKALKGTVDAQARTLETVEGLNSVALSVVQALNPELWAKEMDAWKRMMKESAEARVSAGLRELQGKLDEMQANSRGDYDVLEAIAKNYAALALASVPYVPRSRRVGLIDKALLDEDLKPIFQDWAAKADDLSVGIFGLSDLADLRSALAIMADPPNTQQGGFDVKPPGA